MFSHNGPNTDTGLESATLRHSQLFTVTRQVAPLNCAHGGEVRYRRLPCFCTFTFIFMLPCNHLTKLATRQLFWYTCVMHLFRVALCHVCCRYKLATLIITVRVTYVTWPLPGRLTLTRWRWSSVSVSDSVFCYGGTQRPPLTQFSHNTTASPVMGRIRWKSNQLELELASPKCQLIRIRISFWKKLID